MAKVSLQTPTFDLKECKRVLVGVEVKTTAHKKPRQFPSGALYLPNRPQSPLAGAPREVANEPVVPLGARRANPAHVGVPVTTCPSQSIIRSVGVHPPNGIRQFSCRTSGGFSSARHATNPKGHGG